MVVVVVAAFRPVMVPVRQPTPAAARTWSALGADPITNAQALSGGRDLTHASLSPVIKACAPSTSAAENLSRAAADPQAVVDAWLGSPGHRANLLDPALTETGVACLLDADRMLCAQVFLGP